MKTLWFAAALVSALTLLSGCHKTPKPEDHVTNVAADDAEMNAAIARARAEADTFIQRLQSGGPDGCSVKAPIKDGAKTEHFWLKDVTFQNGSFSGAIDNEPEEVHNVKYGDKITVKKDEISDWLYTQDGKMHGNYTLRALFKTMPPDEAAKYRQMLAD